MIYILHQAHRLSVFSPLMWTYVLYCPTLEITDTRSSIVMQLLLYVVKKKVLGQERRIEKDSLK